MNSKLTIVLAALLVFSILGGCDGTSTAPGLPGGPGLSLDPNAGSHLLADAADIDSAWVEGDTLRLALTYGGGCEEHDFRLVGATGFSGAHPYELPVYIVHDGHGDNCRALVSETRSFDMSPAFSLFRRIFGRDDLVEFRVHTRTFGGLVASADALFFTGASSPPRENVEADRMAMFLSGELTGPEDLYVMLRDDLAKVREEYGNEMTARPQPRPLREIGFRLPWVASEILIGFESGWADSVREGNYRYWGSLNDALGPVEIDPLGSLDAFLLTFDCMLHPCVLASFYKDLPGVRYAEPNWWAGDSPNVFPRATELRTSFLVNEAWGDCPAGCIDNEFWYFEVQLGQVTFLGKGRTLTGEWGSEAQTNINLYQHLSACPAN